MLTVSSSPFVKLAWNGWESGAVKLTTGCCREGRKRFTSKITGIELERGDENILIKDTLKEDKSPNKGQAENTLVYNRQSIENHL